jgi:hypothetical protein
MRKHPDNTTQETHMSTPIGEPECRTCDDWGTIVAIHDNDHKEEVLCPRANCTARDRRTKDTNPPAASN